MVLTKFAGDFVFCNKGGGGGGLQNATKRKVEFQIPVDSLDGFHKSPRGKGWQGSLILNRN